MQYIDIALPIKTQRQQDTFTYRVPPALLPDIQIGQRVEVPFRRRNIVGTVVRLRREAPTIRGSIKEVKRIIEPFALFSAADLTLAQQLADHYGATTGQFLTLAGPKPAIRSAANLQIQRPTTHQSGGLFGLYGPLKQRYQAYYRAIKKTTDKQQGAIILFPSIKQAGYFAQFIEQTGLKVLNMSAIVTGSEHYESWVKAINGEYQLIIGTRKEVFLQPGNLRLLIIDQPSEYGYKEEQFPYYNAVTVGKYKATISGIQLLLGDCAPRVEEWYQYRAGQLKMLQHGVSQGSRTIVDSGRQRGLLNESLKQSISDALTHQKTVALFFNRTGEGRYYHCLDCGTAFYCPRCNQLLQVARQEEQLLLICASCSYQENAPYRCPTCQSYHLGSKGLGISSLASILAQEFPEARISTLQAGETRPDLTQTDILVATAELFYLPPTAYFSTIATYHIDQFLHSPRWTATEEAYLLLSRLAERTDNLLVQTTVPEHPLLLAFTAQQPSQFYDSELEQRKMAAYPPFQPLIKFSYAAASKTEAEQSAQSFYDLLAKTVTQPEINLFPPVPIGSGKRRDKYRYQIIAKLQLTPAIKKLVPEGWQVDPEPQ